MNQHPTNIEGDRNIVAKSVHIHLHIHLLPTGTRGTRSRARTLAIAGLSFGTGIAIPYLDDYPLLATCAIALGVATMGVVLSGGASEEADSGKPVPERDHRDGD